MHSFIHNPLKHPHDTPINLCHRYICNDLNVNSAIAVPDHDEELQLVKGRKYLCQGYAYTGGGRKITRVELSLNSGAMWLCL